MYNRLTNRIYGGFGKAVFLLGLLLLIPVSCSNSTAPVARGNYQTALVGHWQGTIGNYYKENISFKKDNSFKMQMHSGGFIGNTISQGVYGSASGTWKIEGANLLLTISKADNESLFNKSRKYDIVSFTQDELKMEDEKGDTSVFVRIRGM